MIYRSTRVVFFFLKSEYLIRIHSKIAGGPGKDLETRKDHNKEAEI